MIRNPLMILSVIAILPAIAAGKTWDEQVKEAALRAVEKKKNELIEETSKKAIVDIYKKLYPRLKNKSDREALRQLSKVGINVSRLNGLASDLASGDPKKAQGAAELLAVDLGEKLKGFIGDPTLRDRMGSLLGNADKVSELSRHFGAAAGGDPKALLEYAGDMVIQAAGGANVVGFYRTAYGAMELAKDTFVEAEIESLYREYRKGDFDPMRLDLGGTHFALRDKIIAEKAKKAAGLGNVDISEKQREHLTSVDEEAFKERMLAGFEARLKKEQREKEATAEADIAREQTEVMLDQLDSVGRSQGGSNWSEKRSVSIDKFLEYVRRQAEEDPYFDPNSTLDLRILTRLASNKLIYGPNSPEYRKALEDFNRNRDIRRGIDPMPEGILSGKLSGTWSGLYVEGEIRIKVSGSFQIAIDSKGNVSGSYSGRESGPLSGKVNSSGNVDMKFGSGKIGKGSWSGRVSRDANGRLSGKGTFTTPGAKGSWRGTGG